MKQQLKKYYLVQLLAGFVFTILIVNLGGLSNQIDDYSQGRLLILSIVGGLLYTLLNALVNSVNFSYPKKRSKLLAFYLPMVIWLLPLALSWPGLAGKVGEWLLMLIWIEPIVYNWVACKAIASH